MARVKRALNAKKKRRVVLERASGYRGQRSRLYRKAKEQMLHSMTYAYRDRKDKKGTFRRLWIQRINAAARINGITYNRFIQGLRLAGIEVDRKILADLAVNDAQTFATLVESARKALPSDVNAPVAGAATGALARESSTRAVKAAASFTASSASMRRSTSMPAAFRPWMKRLYVMPLARDAALIRWIHSRRKSPFLARRSR